MTILALAPALLAAPLTGVATNKTTGKPAAGDTVVMLNLSQGMQEGGRTKTDAHGRFTLDAGDGAHLIRVDHEKASYFHMAPPGTQSVEIDVYDVLTKVPEVATEADVMRIEADQQGLHVVESYFVKNASSPPKTQFSDHAFEIALPPDAQIEASAALAPNGMPVSSSPVPLSDKGHYAFIFPIRPGETRFQLSYHLPYSGSYRFVPKAYLPTDTVAILLPKSIKFTPGSSSPYQASNEDPTAQTFVMRNVLTSQPLDFTVSGLGSMPREAQGAPDQTGAGADGATGNATAGAQGGAAADAAPNAAASDTRPGGGLGVPIDTPDPLTKYRWWILGGISLLLAVAAAFLLRRPAAAAVAGTRVPAYQVPTTQGLAAHGNAVQVTAASSGGQTPLMAALKEELFVLETDRLAGKITDEEYSQAKSALEVVLRRALVRQGS